MDLLEAVAPELAVGVIGAGVPRYKQASLPGKAHPFLSLLYEALRTLASLTFGVGWGWVGLELRQLQALLYPWGRNSEICCRPSLGDVAWGLVCRPGG